MNIRSLIGSLLVFSFIPISVSAGKVAAQKERRVHRDGNSIEISDYMLIPEATEQSTVEESDWWKQIRKAHVDMLAGYEKRKEKVVAEAKAKFFLLLYEGQQKSYRVPLQDRPPLVLVSGNPTYSYMAQKHKTKGTVDLSVEYQANGLVGDIQIINRLEDGLTENVIEATRKNIFLPAVANRKFVAARQNVKTNFFRSSDALGDWKQTKPDQANQAKGIKN